MVDRPEERRIDERKKRQYELEARIGRTNTGHRWLQRVNQIGKDNLKPIFDDVREEDDGEDTTSS